MHAYSSATPTPTPTPTRTKVMAEAVKDVHEVRREMAERHRG